MLALWLAAIVGLAAVFWTWNRALPRIAGKDLLVRAGLVGVFAPLYLGVLYRWPVQVSSDEEQIVTDTKVRGVIEPEALPSFSASPPFALFVRRDAWERFASATLAAKYPQGRIRNITPPGNLVVFEIRLFEVR
jgi:hypothetical protein